jgi:glc operon protein GlcG
MTRLRSLAATLLVAGLALLPAGAAAQLRTERVLSLEGARKALVASEAEARRNSWPVSIAVVDAAGELLAFVRLDGAHPASVNVSRAKARTAARFRRPTRAMDSLVTAGRGALLVADDALPLEGAVPILVGGVVVGAVGVSGATSAQDAQVAAAGAAVVVP